MPFADELTIIRRYLRDPDANIWSDESIRTFWNDTQHEIASKIGFLERVDSYRWPPAWTWSYQRDWEYPYVDGDRYQCLLLWQARNMECCYPWEPAYWLTSSGTTDDGTRFTYPWEAVYCSPADVVPLPLHQKFNRMKFAAFDEEEITAIDRKQLAQEDSHYRTAPGSPYHYWRPDQYFNSVVLYPRPSSTTWDDDSLAQNPLDTYDDAGGTINWQDTAVDTIDSGLVLDTIGTENNLFAVFEALPADVPDDRGDWLNVEIDWPAFLVKYIRFGTLERCFGVDTDGFIPSLRDFWRLRKEAGILAMKRYRNLRKTDRDYQMGGGGGSGRSRHPRLPSEYPRQWP
jgi:hypothetical protein